MKILIKDGKSPGFFSVSIIVREFFQEWLTARISFQLNGFSAEFDFSLMVGELVIFYKELLSLNNTLKGTAHFKNLEDNVGLTFSIDNLGHVQGNGTLRDRLYAVKMSFLLEFDQTYLPGILHDYRNIIKELKLEVD